MKPRHLVVAALVILAGPGVSTSGPPTYTTCDSCADCSAKLASGDWDLVQLTVDIIDQGGNCVTIYLGESNVSFDCNGHLIDGDDVAIDPDYGISMMWGADNAISNCTVSDFSVGIKLAGASTHTLANNTLLSNGVGIELTGSTIIDMHHNDARENHVGIELDSSNSNTVSFNRACFNATTDFSVSSSTGNVGTENVCDLPDGWNDTATAGCTKGCVIFEDGFELGNTDHWSSTAP